MATSSFDREFIITDKKDVDFIIDALVSDSKIDEKNERKMKKMKEKIEKDAIKGRELLLKFAYQL